VPVPEQQLAIRRMCKLKDQRLAMAVAPEYRMT
jgi:hypothetical protein